MRILALIQLNEEMARPQPAAPANGRNFELSLFQRRRPRVKAAGNTGASYLNRVPAAFKELTWNGGK